MIKIHNKIEPLSLFSNFSFSKDGIVSRCYSTSVMCGFCGTGLNFIYVEIIKRLKQKGLLDEDYKERCCFCEYVNRYERIIMK